MTVQKRKSDVFKDGEKSKRSKSITEFFKAVDQNPKRQETITKITGKKGEKDAGTLVIEDTKVENPESTKKLEKTDKLEETASINVNSDTDVPCSEPTPEDELSSFRKEHPFDKAEWVKSLSEENRSLLQLEIDTIEISWLTILHKEFTKPYFLQLKRFLAAQAQANKTIFPPAPNVYSWTRLTPVYKIKVLILGQDPYHNFNQAHGLAFSVKEPTPPPPSLKNIYKCLKLDYPEFTIPTGPNAGNLEKWANRGVLMLNACLTVAAHQANSHSGKGWEEFTEAAIKAVMMYHKKDNKGFVVLAWGSPAQKRIDKLQSVSGHCCILRSVHPSPLSASRGFFKCEHFKKCNLWLKKNYGNDAVIDWGIVEGNVVS